MSDISASTGYVIPKRGQSYMTTIEEYAFNICSELIEKSRIEKNARLIDGCNVISYENNFVALLDQGYKSYLLGLYTATVALCGMTTERICYDSIEHSRIEFNNTLLTVDQKKHLLNMPFNRIVDFLLSIGLITKGIRENMVKINDIRNRYVHPTLRPDNSFDDAKNCLNLLCKIIDAIANLKI